MWLAKPLCRLFNQSLQTSCLPKEWRQANVTPIFKKGNRHPVCNYRPISLTCLVVKVLERIVARKIPEFEKFHNKLSHHQHGFREDIRAKHSYYQLCTSGLKSSTQDLVLMLFS